jgi:putative PIN family toxin of toxin-antitoxin system
MRVVFDTNVLVAAIRSNKGASYQLLSMLPERTFELAISNALYFEYLDVLLRSENRPSAMTELEMIDAIDEITRYAVYQDVFFRWRPWLNDENDDMVLELAIASQCDFIVTFNLKDFRNVELFGIVAISPSDFLEFLRGRTR